LHYQDLNDYIEKGFEENFQAQIVQGKEGLKFSQILSLLEKNLKLAATHPSLVDNIVSPLRNGALNQFFHSAEKRFRLLK